MNETIIRKLNLKLPHLKIHSLFKSPWEVPDLPLTTPATKSVIEARMNKLLQLIIEGEKLQTEELAEVLSISESEVESELASLKESGILLGWRPIINPDHLEANLVRAVIEIKIRPERDGGFDRMAMRISRFDEVESCYLMSGGYDLLAIVVGDTLHQVANFISQKLATMDGVLSTGTHFLLRAYKEQGFELVENIEKTDRPAVSA